MEGQPTKRRRIYSVEPSEIAQAVFARSYVSYLVPALMKLKQKQKETSNAVAANVVKHEVGMAMVWSAPPGFAWANALKAKLLIQTHHHHVNVENDDQNAPSHFSSKFINVDDLGMEDNNEEEEDDDDDDDDEPFSRLRRLIPGGEEMGDDDEEMVQELVSYIRCLQMQVNILHCLAHTHTP